MAEQEKNQEHQLNIEISEQVAEGEYVNLALIAHSQSEFVFDFIKMMPGTPKAKVKSRIIMTPEHAKRLLTALKDNIKKYESNFSGIREGKDEITFPMSFGPIGEA